MRHLHKLPLYALLIFFATATLVNLTGCSVATWLPTARMPEPLSEHSDEEPGSLVTHEELRNAISKRDRAVERWLDELEHETEIIARHADASRRWVGRIDGLASAAGNFVASDAGASMLGAVVPGAGLLGTLAGLFIKRPRDKSPREVERETDESYQRGKQEAQKLIDELVTIAQAEGWTDVERRIQESIASLDATATEQTSAGPTT